VKPLKISAAPPPEESSDGAHSEFFLDRCLGKTVAEKLRAAGWIIHRVGDHFRDDGQGTSDPDWIAYGLSHGWALLTQDQRIRYRADEIGAVEVGKGVMFQLSNGNLTIAQKIGYFDDNRSSIFAAAKKPGPALYRVYVNRIAKIWPAVSKT
jgi:PIN like domain